MNASGIREGDIVLCNVRGQQFYALVKEPVHENKTLQTRVLSVRPLDTGFIPAQNVTPRQIKEHWRKARRRLTEGK